MLQIEEASLPNLFLIKCVYMYKHVLCIIMPWKERYPTVFHKAG